MDQAASCGIMGQILVVDLSSSRISTRPLDGDRIEAFIGGRGLAMSLLWEEMDPRTPPLDARSVMVIATSPLTGTRAPTAGRGHAAFKSPLTGTVGSSNSGGDWAVHLKGAGFDAVILKGSSPAPVYLLVSDEQVTLEDASFLWGKGVPETTDLLLARHPEGRARVLCTGSAGENLVRYASLMNERNRAYGRGGAGAVWGSKRLKAIVVKGSREVSIGDPDLFDSGVGQALYRTRAAPITKRILRTLGTAGLVKLIHVIDMLPRNNFRTTKHRPEDLDRICGETIRKEILVRSGGCYRCPIACQRHTRVGEMRGEGPEFETVILMGPVCGVYDLKSITRANYFCNLFGLDTISYGGTLAAAMDLFEEGILSRGETGGLELKFGNARALEDLVRLTAVREGFGDSLAEGSLRLATKYGRPELAMAVKGMELPAYDPRASFTQALGYMTSPTGGCHLRGGYAVSLAFFGGAKENPRFSIRQSPVAVHNVQNIGILQDSLGICRFTGFAFGLDIWARVLAGVTGKEFSLDRLDEAANRIAVLERLFNVRAGITAAGDTLPRRFQEEPIHTQGMEMRVAPRQMEKLRGDYYKVRGWSQEGIPTEDTLERLSLAQEAKRWAE